MLLTEIQGMNPPLCGLFGQAEMGGDGGGVGLPQLVTPV
jgi:hypothetical protein